MNIIELAKQANGEPAWNGGVDWTWDELKRFAALVEAAARADERDRITKMLNYLDMKAQPYHNYYRHAAVEINRKEGEGENI